MASSMRMSGGCPRLGIRQADKVLAISHTTLAALKNSFGVVDPLLVPMGIESRMLRTKHREESSYDFVFVGRLVPQKRPLDFILALAKLRKKYNWQGKAVVIGDGPMKLEIEMKLAQLDLQDRILLTGLVSIHQRDSLLADSKLFVNCSEREGFSVATLEAFASGLPAIVAVPDDPEVFGVSEIAIDKKNCMFYPVGDINLLAEMMWFFITTPGHVYEMAHAARQTAANYTWETIVQDFQDHFSHLLKPHSPNL